MDDFSKMRFFNFLTTFKSKLICRVALIRCALESTDPGASGGGPNFEIRHFGANLVTKLNCSKFSSKIAKRKSATKSLGGRLAECLVFWSVLESRTLDEILSIELLIVFLGRNLAPVVSFEISFYNFKIDDFSKMRFLNFCDQLQKWRDSPQSVGFRSLAHHRMRRGQCFPAHTELKFSFTSFQNFAFSVCATASTHRAAPKAYKSQLRAFNNLELIYWVLKCQGCHEIENKVTKISSEKIVNHLLSGDFKPGDED